MTFGGILSLMMLAGVLSLMAAFVVHMNARRKRRAEFLRQRLSLDVAVETENSDRETDAISLRRKDVLIPWALLRDFGVLEKQMLRLVEWHRSLGYAQVAMGLLVGGIVAASAIYLLGFSVVLALVMALMISVLVWLFISRRRRAKRKEMIAEQVPEAIDLMVRALRVGSPFTAALGLVGRNLDGPIADEFTATVQEINYGQDVMVALNDLAERCDNQDLRFLAAGAAIQQTSGGNLAELLERISAICRSRQAMTLKIKSLTSEARWSGNVLSMFPVAAAAGIMLLSPNYFDEVSKADFFPGLMAVVGLLLLGNVIFMRRMLVLDD